MWFRNKRPSHLPVAKGPFLPGCVDYMTEYSERGFLIRLFYPTEKTGNINKYRSKWIPWCPDETYIDGFSKVLHVMSFAIRIVMWWTSGNIHIPTLYGEKVNNKSKLKPIIFSHGLGGFRFLYSVICNELASWGYLIAIIEHRDGSACNTYYYKSKEDVEKDRRTAIEYVNIDLGKGHYKKRNQQIHNRFEDCEKVLQFLLNINSGKISENVLKDHPTEKSVSFDIRDLIGQIDIDNITMMGHSFGGATALYAISQRKEFQQGVLFDPWMFSIKDEKDVFQISKPLLFVNTFTFHILTNVKAMEKLLNCDRNKMYTIINTTHESQTDTIFVAGSWLNWFMTKLDPEKAIDINNYLVLRFLNQYSPSFCVNIEDCEKYLNKEKKNFVEGLTKPWA